MFLKEVECHIKRDNRKVERNALPGYYVRQATPSKDPVSIMPWRAKPLEKFKQSITKYQGLAPKSEKKLTY